MIEEHMRMEENEVFPAFRTILSPEQNARLTSLMNKEGFKVA
jgi:hemerythrin-like domain-containing protein